MLVSPLRIFATLAMAVAVAEAITPCIISCAQSASASSGCNLYVLLSHRRWTSFPHVSFFLASMLVRARAKPSRMQPALVSRRTARREISNYSWRSNRRGVLFSEPVLAYHNVPLF